MLVLTAACATALALVHLIAGKLRFLDAVPRSRWLSFAGGVAVAFVFLHILPELSRHRQTLSAGLDVGRQAAEAWVYVLAFAGLALFYGLERAAQKSRRSRDRRVASRLLWLHVGSFGIYNVLVGYLLLHREDPGPLALTTFTIAMSLHFITNDYGLRQDHKDQYDARGRWVLAGAVLCGWALGALTTLPRIIVGFLFAFLAGGIVFNALKEELPEERQSRFWPFVLGGSLYAVLLLLV